MKQQWQGTVSFAVLPANVSGSQPVNIAELRRRLFQEAGIFDSSLRAYNNTVSYSQADFNVIEFLPAVQNLQTTQEAPI
jgi:hypothetical protein